MVVVLPPLPVIGLGMVMLPGSHQGGDTYRWDFGVGWGWGLHPPLKTLLDLTGHRYLEPLQPCGHEDPPWELSRHPGKAKGKEHEACV